MRLSVALALALTPAFSALALAEPPKPLATFEKEGGAFIDDPFAVRDDGQELAWLTTDGATSATLHLSALPPTGPEVKLPGLPADVTALYFLGPNRVLVVLPAGEQRTAQVYTGKGAGKEKLGPADDVTLGTALGRPAVITFARKEAKKGGADLLLTAFARDTLKPFAKKVLHETAEGQIAHPQGPFKILWWRDGYSGAATLKAGEYDKARDLRRPDRFARFDPWQGKITEEKEIEDVMGFAKAGLAHKDHAHEAAFVRLSEDRRQLLYTDGLEDHELQLARPLSIYDSTTIAYQPLDADRFAVSATVDPANPPALERKKVDPDDLDLFTLDRKTRAATLVLRLPGQGRPTAWRIGGHRVALLRKSKGFDRGGVQLEVYELQH